MNIAEELTGLQHIGIPVTNLDLSVKFYNMLGFTENDKHSIVVNESKLNVSFMSLGNLVLELYQSDQDVPVKCSGAVDHIALNCLNIQKLFDYCKENNLHFLEEKINFLPFNKNGVKYFIVLGPDNEKIEFNQKLG